MIIILSPSKTMDMSEAELLENNFSEKTHSLVKKIKTFSKEELSKTMKIKEKILESTFDLYKNFDNAPSKSAIEAYTGFVFKGLKLKDYSEDQRSFLDNHFVILSALYGCILPATKIKEYRLDMTMKLDSKENPYTFWNKEINSSLVSLMDNNKEKVLVNLASNEFSKIIDRKNFPFDVVDIDFKEQKDGKFKSVATYAKKARGIMSNYIIKNMILDKDDLKSFNEEGYFYNKELSSEKKYVFTR